METKDTQISCDVMSLREEISQNEQIILDYLNTARNMKSMAIFSTILALVFFVYGSYYTGGGALFLGFLCIRKYNKSIGMAEVYNGVTKYLKLVLQREVTGDDRVFDFLK